MGIKRMMQCDICTKLGDFWKERDDWFIVNITYTICSEECFDNPEGRMRRNVKIKGYEVKGYEGETNE